MPHTESPWRNKRQIALHFGISEKSVLNLMRRRILPYSKTGRIVKFDIHACDKAFKALELKSCLVQEHALAC